MVGHSFAWLIENSSMAADIATVVGVLVAGLALGFAWGQISSNRASQRETTAKALYANYLRLAFENPVLASPKLAQYDHSNQTIDGDRVLYERYEWFVSILLDAGEEILRLSPSAAWRATVRKQIEYHTEYLARHFDQYASEYEQVLRRVVREAAAQSEASRAAGP